MSKRSLGCWVVGLLAASCGAEDDAASTAPASTEEAPRSLESATPEPAGSGANRDAPAGSEASSGLEANINANLDAAAGDPLLVMTTSGALRGIAAGAVEQFLGVPYAAAPLGALRLAPPASPEPWAGVRDASAAGDFCPQYVAGRVQGSEDCLFLNVHRPAQPDPAQPLPVMVWIHGGSFVSGAGSAYDPRRLVEANGVIVVTLNYRLGALGFLAHPALTAESPEALSGDYGLLDQQAALRWVRDNIAAFGGDPAQVTIQGQSAGGASVCAQLASPPAAGLFSRAVIQSASCASVPLALAEAQGVNVASALGCTDAASGADCLRELTLEQLVSASAAAVFGPVVGGSLLPEAPFAVVVAGTQHPVPVLVGGVSDEMRGFFALEYPLDPAAYPAALAAHFPGVPTPEIEARYPLASHPEPYLALTAALSDSGAYLSGSLGGCVTSLLADTLAGSTPTFAYELDDPRFTWAPEASPIPVPRGASHSSDLAFLFDTVGFSLSVPFDAEQTALAAQMVSAWGSFIRSGDPSVPGALEWPRYDLAERRMLHLEPDEVAVTTDFRERHHCAFWFEGSTQMAAPAP